MMSSRLPKKILLDLHGHPIYEWVFRRLKSSKNIDLIIFALPDNKSDDILASNLSNLGANVRRGSEDDLVDRFYQIAKSVNAKKIVRICADNPLICSSEVDRLIEFYNNNEVDYAYNHLPKNNFYPDGLGAEICSMELLEEIYINSILPEHREHLFNYIWDNENRYMIKTFNPPSKLAFPNLKLDIDTMKDYLKLSKKAYRIDMNADEIIKISLGKKHEIN